MEESNFRFAISLSVLNHLGRNLYRNFITVLGEAISNSWDADARNVWINIDRDHQKFTVVDDGKGMDQNAFQNKFLKIGYSKRKEGGGQSESGRPFIGAKGIGKLALLSCARIVTIKSKAIGQDPIGGRIDNGGLDAAITNDLVPDEYPLEIPDEKLTDPNYEASKSGTLIVFEDTEALSRVTVEQVRTLIAMNFRFSLIDKNFSIWVNGEEITISDLNQLAESTQFLWTINSFTDDFLKTCVNIKRNESAPETTLRITGYFATVEKPSDLKIRGRGNDERATVDLFVNGRLREKNLIRHFPTQRIVESYLYGQIHFDEMDGDGDSPFTSSREGVVDGNPQYRSLIDYLKQEMLPRVIDQWDKFRLEINKPGDSENTKRKSKRDRSAADLVSAVAEDYKIPDANKVTQDKVDKWVNDLHPDAEFNTSAYVDCYLSENLVRKYIIDANKPLSNGVQKEADSWKSKEVDRKNEAGISYDIRRSTTDLSYLGMDALAVTAEGSKPNNNTPSLWKDAITFRPIRNAVGHTGLLTDTAKTQLSLTLTNIKARIKTLLKNI
ncbi:ATP-binding protein [Sphingopyxis yananensis]|uniref:ATP-binding protein n=1 Tax=Sphingopyxis yananensis TaxID=2886687 RepID=UPI001D0F8FF8|nr:ATP-binding protein [Sphingopyxis yananensis]MCC2602551.1 ATP-binding protein [Sphingopyxis yananensis]